jgi:hypothetical protein
MQSNGAGGKDNTPSEEENPFTQSITAVESVGTQEGKAGHEQGGLLRHRVRIHSKRVRICDPDNLVGGVKHLIDSLRYAQIIPEDDPQAIYLQVSQEKVKSYQNEETWVEVSR